MATKQEMDKARQELNSWFLGKTSAKHESSSGNPGVISTGKGDPGGVSYGSYQLSTNKGILQDYLKQTNNYNHHFDGLTPKTKAFDDKWRELAHKDPAAFHESQHDYIIRTHYQTQIKHLANAKGKIDLSNRGKAVQDMIYSISVQHGGRTGVILRAQKESGVDFTKASDAEIISVVMDNKLRHYKTDFRNSSPNRQEGIRKRIIEEKQDLLRLNRYENIIKQNVISEPKNTKENHSSIQSKSEKLPPAVHKLHNECREKLQAFCHKHGIKSDSPTDIDNVSMALAAEAYKNRMTGVSHLHLDIKENKVAAMNYEPDLRTAALNLAQAVTTSISESMDKIKHISEQFLNHQQQQTQQMVQNNTCQQQHRSV